MSRGKNRVEVPEAREAMDKFKMEIAGEIGVPLTNGYNGNLTSAQNGSVGGEMVRQMIKRQEEMLAGK
ncbi:MAG: small, acid-soluble spore protein, alpha/beta type [Lachnospiraceae bacterium]